MLVKADVPKTLPKPIAGQFGGNNSQYSLATYKQFKAGLAGMLSGDFQIQSTDEASLVISRDTQGNEVPENNISVSDAKKFFQVPLVVDDTPPLEISASFIISGVDPTSSGYQNAADVINGYNSVFGPAAVNGTIDGAVAFLSKYWGFSDGYAREILASRNIQER